MAEPTIRSYLPSQPRYVSARGIASVRIPAADRASLSVLVFFWRSAGVIEQNVVDLPGREGLTQKICHTGRQTGLLVVVEAVAYEVTRSRELALVLETQVAVAARGDDRGVEIDQV